MLGAYEHNGKKALRYLLIYSTEAEFQLWVQESYDEGSETFYDIGEFTPVHDDNETIYTFSTLDETLNFASKKYRANPEHWVNESMLDDEYADANQYRRP